jgi:hypothetical protein
MSDMSYDLAVWVGEQPASATDADNEYARRMDAMEEALDHELVVPPAPELIAFVEAVLDRYPELDEDSGPECPWASAPLRAEIVGDLIYFPMTFSGAEFARDVVADIAGSLELVCYDPQLEALLPDSSATPASVIGDRAFTALQAHAGNLGASPRPGKRSWLRRIFGRNR